MRKRRARWRDYRTASGRRPVKEFLEELSDDDAAAVLDAMRAVRDEGLTAARHVENEIWEVRVDGLRVIYRILFAPQGSKGQILLSLEAFKKKTRRTPRDKVAVAKRRLRDWKSRGSI